MCGGAWAIKRGAQDGFWADIAIWPGWTSSPTVQFPATLVQVHPNIAAHEDCERICDILRLLHPGPGLWDPWLVTLDTADLGIESCYLLRCSASVARIPASSILRTHAATTKQWQGASSNCDITATLGLHWLHSLRAFISSLELSTESCSTLASIH